MTGVKVAAKAIREDGKRVYDKRYPCLFCQKELAKLPRHLETAHSNEREVMMWVSCTTKSLKQQLYIKMKNQGAHIHNQAMLREGSGNLKVKYRPQTDCSVANYIPCSDCYVYLSKRDMWKHAKVCPFKKEEKSKNKTRVNHVLKGKLLMGVSGDATEQLNSVFATLKDDECGSIIKKDSLLRLLGEQMAVRHGHEKHKHNYIRNTLRELGRLLLELKKTHSGDLASFIDPGYFDAIVEATRTVVGYNSSTNLMTIPSMALKLGASLNKCALLLQSTALKNYDEEAYKLAQQFETVMSNQWTTQMSINALRTLTTNKKNRIKLLPLSEDINQLSNFLKEEIEKHLSALKSDNRNKTAYSMLSKRLLASLIVFNRKRSGEVSRMKLSEFYGLAANSTSVGEDEMGLSKLELALASKFQRIEIEGKRGRTVPILLTEQMREALDLMVGSRQAATINTNNEYVFAASVGLGSLRGCDVIRECSVLCGANRPEALRSTSLRKQIATMAQILNLKNNELDSLANFMGHDIRVHRNFYRLSDEATQLAKISKILMAADSGKLSNYSGQSLDDIDLDDEFDGKKAV